MNEDQKRIMDLSSAVGIALGALEAFYVLSEGDYTVDPEKLKNLIDQIKLVMNKEI